MFGFHEQMIVVAYKPKRKKNVLVLSTFHLDDQVDPESGESLKSEMITSYNFLNGGVDVVVEIKSLYFVSRFCCS